jgi:lipopolysaccharide transport protein LptA
LWLVWAPLAAQDPVDAGEAVTEITSKHLVFDYAEKLAVFTGDVVVTDPDMQLSADTLRVFLTEDDEIRRIEAEGNVVIKMEGLHSQSGRADYVPKTGVLVLTREPQVSREGSIMQAVKFTYYQLDNRLEADGQVRLLNFQGAGGDEDVRP